MGVQEKREQETGSLFQKLVSGNFPNLVKKIGMQVQEVQSPEQDENRTTPRHIKTKMQEVKDK